MRVYLTVGVLLATIHMLWAGSQASPGNAVEDERTAIAIGQQSCRGDQTEDKFFKLTPREKWHARRSGDTWLVWYDKRRHGHAFMEVEVSRLTGKATDCLVWVE
jgi:hypothetical protein